MAQKEFKKNARKQILKNKDFSCLLTDKNIRIRAPWQRRAAEEPLCLTPESFKIIDRLGTRTVIIMRLEEELIIS